MSRARAIELAPIIDALSLVNRAATDANGADLLRSQRKKLRKALGTAAQFRSVMTALLDVLRDVDDSADSTGCEDCAVVDGAVLSRVRRLVTRYRLGNIASVDADLIAPNAIDVLQAFVDAPLGKYEHETDAQWHDRLHDQLGELTRAANGVLELSRRGQERI